MTGSGREAGGQSQAELGLAGGEPTVKVAGGRRQPMYVCDSL